MTQEPRVNWWRLYHRGAQELGFSPEQLGRMTLIQLIACLSDQCPTEPGPIRSFAEYQAAEQEQQQDQGW